MADDRLALIKQIKEANDIVAVVGSYLPLRPLGPTFKGLCPFHNDHRPSFDVDPRRQRYRCWSCGKFGDVISFVQEFEKIGFPEALEALARRVGISLDPARSGANSHRAKLIDAVRWAAELYQECLLESPLAEEARTYLGERRLTGETVRRWGLGYAPVAGDWLVRQAGRGGPALETLVEVGLLWRRENGAGCADRFRDRIMFPIRTVTGQPIGFGGRILPKSPYAQRAPKYYNSAETPLFSKGELFYGLDLARQAATTAGYLAVVEGYTDVLMAHQSGVGQVVATMGTALTPRHVQQLRRFVPRVVLVFDADAGGTTGVDRALELFVSQDVELAIATLPAGLDPFDLLTQPGGPEAFRRALEEAVDALEFKLNQVLAREEGRGVEGQRRVVDAVLGIMAMAPGAGSQAAQVKQELIVTRIAHRLGLRETTLWDRLTELRAGRRQRETHRPAAEEPDDAGGPDDGQPLRRTLKEALPHERELLEVLLAEPALVEVAAEQLPASEVTHPGLRRMLEALYVLQREGEPADLDSLRVRLMDPRAVRVAFDLQYVGRMHPDRADWLKRILAVFLQRRRLTETQRLQTQLTTAADHAQAVELLRRLQNQTVGPDLP